MLEWMLGFFIAGQAKSQETNTPGIVMVKTFWMMTEMEGTSWKGITFIKVNGKR